MNFLLQRSAAELPERAAGKAQPVRGLASKWLQVVFVSLIWQIFQPGEFQNIHAETNQS